MVSLYLSEALILQGHPAKPHLRWAHVLILRQIMSTDTHRKKGYAGGKVQDLRHKIRTVENEVRVSENDFE